MSSRDHVDTIIDQWAAERPDLDASTLHVIGRISRLAQTIDRQLRPVFAAHGLGDGDFFVLATLRRDGAPYELTPSELGASTMVTSGAVTKRLDRLERAGLVERRQSETDGRGRRVRLTAAGVALMDEAYPAHLANEERMLAGLSDDERAALVALLRRLGDSLDDAPPPDMRP